MRFVVLGTSAVLGIIITRLIIENFGKAAYAQYGLLVALGALIPFADLGISGAIMNAIGGSKGPNKDDAVRLVLVSSIRIAVGAALVVALVSVVITATGLWPAILGEGLNPDTGPLAAGICLALIGAAIPFGIGQRIITALSKNHISIALQGLQSPLVLALLTALLWLAPQLGWVIPAIPYVVTLIIVIIASMIAARMLRPMLGRALRDARALRTIRGGKVSDMAWPLMVQMIALPMAMQTDRIVLSHVSDVDQLAQYNMGSQLFNPVWALVGAAGWTLWPVFARARSEGTRISPLPLSAGFGAVAAVLCLALAAISPWLVKIASDSEVTLTTLTIASFTVFMVLQAVKYPLGMYMTSPAGMRFQALMVVLMIPVNLGLSIYLAGVIGAAGPIIGSAVGVLIFQVIANYIYVRVSSRREPAPAELVTTT